VEKSRIHRLAALLRKLFAGRSQSCHLTSREEEILVLVLMGFANKRVADHCCICEQTVKDHLRHAYQKIGIHQRTELLPWLLGFETSDFTHDGLHPLTDPGEQVSGATYGEEERRQT
jgi:DNA-binding CsgD family transcriptional regulator